MENEKQKRIISIAGRVAAFSGRSSLLKQVQSALKQKYRGSMQKAILSRFVELCKKAARFILPKAASFGSWAPLYLGRLARVKTGDIVAGGPFQGLRLPGESFASVYTPKLIGCYEKELHNAVEQIIKIEPDLIVDVGAAEGYYAAGLALRCPTAEVTAYEAQNDGRILLAKTIEINGLSDKIKVKATCTLNSLSQELRRSAERPAIIMDCEGAEGQLLCPDSEPKLRSCIILVENHDFIAPGTSLQICRRFGGTHRITRISQQVRDASEFPYRSLITLIIPRIYNLMAVYEHRPRECHDWLFMVPRELDL